MGEEKKQKKKPKLTKRFIWRLPVVMAERRVFKHTELRKLLAGIGIEISTVHVGRIFRDMPELLNTDLLLGLMQVLNCNLDDLIWVEDVTPEDDGTDTDTNNQNPVGSTRRKIAPPLENHQEKAEIVPVRPREVKEKERGNVIPLKDYDPEIGPKFGSKRNLRREALEKE